jgi:hypothetical protein
VSSTIFDFFAISLQRASTKAGAAEADSIKTGSRKAAFGSKNINLESL